MAHEAGTACPCDWQHSAASPRAAQALHVAVQLREHVFWTCTRASAIRRAIQQPPSFRAAATTACVAARAAMPNSEEGSVVCCVPSCPDCHV